MRQRLLLLNILCFSLINVLLAEPPYYIQTKDGVIVFTDPVFTDTSNAVKLEVASDNITRVIAAPGTELVAVQSLVTVYAKKLDVSCNVVSSIETLTLKTKKPTAIVNLKTGAVTSCDNSGKKILIEKPTGGRGLQSAIFDGRRIITSLKHFKLPKMMHGMALGSTRMRPSICTRERITIMKKEIMPLFQ